MKRDDLADAALDLPFDPANAELVDELPRAKIVYSTRIDPKYSDRIAAEAARCGVTPHQLIGQLAIEALEARESGAQLVTVNIADLHRAIDEAARRAA